MDGYFLGTMQREKRGGTLLERKPVVQDMDGYFFQEKNDYSTRLTSFFIFSPFTDEVIELPALNRRYDKVAFSSSPALDADCVFFALLDCSNYLHISTCRCGNKNWKKLKFQSPMIQGVNYLPILDITYVHGFFSCVFACGVLGAFSVAQQDWRVLADSPVRGINAYRAHFIAADGNLLLVLKPSWRVWKFDWSRLRWIEQKSVGNRVLFLGSSSFSIPAVGEASKFADCLFYEGATELKPYSLKTGTYEMGCETYSWIPKERLKRIWIELPPAIC